MEETKTNSNDDHENNDHSLSIGSNTDATSTAAAANTTTTTKTSTTTVATTITESLNHRRRTVEMEDIMESMVRITLAGCGGSMVGLSLQHKLDSMRVVTAAGLSAAARRKRIQQQSSFLTSTATTNRPFPMVMTWGISCMIFCSIIETARLTSPSTIIMQNFGDWWDRTRNQDGGLEGHENHDSFLHKFPFHIITASTTTATTIKTILDYSIGGMCAGLVGSLGRPFSTMISTTMTPYQFSSYHNHNKIPSPKRFFGVGPGLALGLMAGCIQAGADYGMMIARRAQETQTQQQQQQRENQSQDQL